MILAIDPGPTKSAFVYLVPGRIVSKGILENRAMLENVDQVGLVARAARAKGRRIVCAIEMIASYGMAVGAEVFETCVWIGRFAQQWSLSAGVEADRITRSAVKMHLCRANNAKDSNVRQALIDMYGGQVAAIGRKKTPGPLYGVTKDTWAALAVGVVYADKHLRPPRSLRSELLHLLDNAPADIP